ncbi:hypothetical protein AAMO2058_000076000 [Amorphochlora amoebiformis]
MDAREEAKLTVRRGNDNAFTEFRMREEADSEEERGEGKEQEKRGAPVRSVRIKKIAKKRKRTRKSHRQLKRYHEKEFKKLNPKMDTIVLAAKMCWILKERKKELFAIILRDIGHALALQVMNETMKSLKKGGMFTQDGQKTRSPGGTFLTILRKHVSPDDYKKLMKDNRRISQKNKKKAVHASKLMTEEKDICSKESIEQDELKEGPGALAIVN